jgi:hypothetical protein
LTTVADAEKLIRASDPEPVTLIVSSTPYRGPWLPVGAWNLLDAVVAYDSAEGVSGLRTRFGLNDQDK